MLDEIASKTVHTNKENGQEKKRSTTQVENTNQNSQSFSKDIFSCKRKSLLQINCKVMHMCNRILSD